LNIHKELVKGMFSKENINEQLVIVKQKGLNWADLSNPAKSDVTVDENMSMIMIDEVKHRIKDAKLFADVSCGTGELVVQAVKQGFSGKAYIFDRSVVNIEITKLRLAKLQFNNVETVVYDTPEEFINYEIGDDMKFDIIVGNPPYEGKAQTHQKFFNKCIEDLVVDDGIVIFIQPDTAYVSKKDYVGYPIYKHTNKMKENIKKYKTSVKLVEGTIFEGADVATSLAITTLIKTPDKTIEVEYMSGNIYSHIDIESINKAGIEPVLYQSVKQKIESYITKNGSMHDIEYCDINSRDPKVVYKIAMLRGNRGTDDFYTMVTRDKDKHKVEDSCFGFKIEPDQEESMYSYLTSFLARFALSIYKTNTNNHVGEMRIVPLVSFDRIWTDEMLAKEWEVSNDELDAIKKILPDYYNIC